MDISTFSTRPSLASIWYLKWRPVSKQIQNVRAYPRARIATIGARRAPVLARPADSPLSVLRRECRVRAAAPVLTLGCWRAAAHFSRDARAAQTWTVGIVTWGIWNGDMVFNVNFLL